MDSTASLLHKVLNPDCVAVVGASADSAKFGGRVMHFLVEHRYGGRIVPVNPGAGEILGIPAYRSIGDARVPVDVALLAVPAQHVPVALAECGAAGVRCCVVLTAGFAEIGAEGAACESELTRVARSYGMRLIGPNCLGYINPRLNLALTSSVALAAGPMPRGAIGLVSQSGSLMAAMISHAQDLGTGVSTAVTVGNQADLETCDFVEYFIADATTRAICIYVEGLKDGRRLLELAGRAAAAGKPLLAVKAGRSEAGVRIARSHTASLAGSHAVWEAACRDRAVCLLDDPESMIHCADFLVRFGVPHCDGVAALSPSGGTIAVTSDRIVTAGLQLAELTPETCGELRKFIPAGRPLNPLDVGGLPRNESMEGALRAQNLLARDPRVGVLLIVAATTPQFAEKVRRWGVASLELGKPTAMLLTPGSLADGARAALRDIGCPFTNRMDDALRVVRTAIEYGRALRAGHEKSSAPAFCADVASFAARRPSGRLTEFETKQMLRAAGVATTGDVVAASVHEAVSAASAMGYPVALKAGCRDLLHKSDVGGVKLGLADAQGVRRAWHDIRESLARSVPHARFEGVTVQPMVTGGIEMIVGTKWDPQFGAVVMTGAGGVWVELLQDAKLALAPITASQALVLIRALRVWPLLSGARGEPRADVEGFADTVSRVSWIAAALGPRLAELDVNPLLVKRAGEGTIALDGRATLTEH